MNINEEAEVAWAIADGHSKEIIAMRESHAVELAMKDAEIERLKAERDQAIAAGELTIQTITPEEKGYGMHRYVGETIIVGRSDTEVFYGSRLHDSPELAAYLKEKEVSE